MASLGRSGARKQSTLCAGTTNGQIRHVGVHGSLHARRDWTAQGAPRDDPLGLHGSPALGGCYAEKGRIVRDGSALTAGGVTSGIDFGLSIAAELAGYGTAQAIQLGIEYDPAPPFDAGHPDRAPEGP